MAERQRLTVDLESLFPGETITIGDQILDIRPLGIKQLAILARKLKGLGSLLESENITLDNYNQPANIFKIAVLLLEQFPEVLEEASNIALEDLEPLPLDIIVEIVEKVIAVNSKSKDKFLGNFQSLIKKLNLEPEVKTPKPKSVKRSKN